MAVARRFFRPLGHGGFACLAALAAMPAHAGPDDATATPGVVAVAQAPTGPEPGHWMDTFKVSGHIETGITGNPDAPRNHLNFGHLFTDRANEALLDQLMGTVERPLDPKAEGVDIGFKLQGMFGSDARYTHFLGELDRDIGARHQVDIVEANLLMHLPVSALEGGMDVKAGQYSTPLGAEVIDATGNFFYSHSYIFNFGLPFKHTGALATMHATSLVDLYLGVDSGVNTSIGKGDNNDDPAGLTGFGLNLWDGKATVLALTHIGPENPKNTLGVPNGALRYINDITTVVKPNDKLTLTTDLNWIRDDGFKADGYGAEFYGVYAINEWLSGGGRVEVWRDAQGFFVGAFPGNLDFVNLERGFPATVFGGGRTTYFAGTLGLNIKPPTPDGVPLLQGIVFRPELRYDRSLSGTRPFDAGTSVDQVTIAGDLIISF